jgi:carbon-monoxide dehydrogenase medium subunit
MSLPKFEYMTATSLEEAANLKLGIGDSAVVMAGGTDVIPLLKDRVIRPEYVIDLKTIKGLDKLEYVAGSGLTIGALVKLRTIESDETVRAELPALSEAAHYVASTQVRFRGTLVGNICNASPSADTASILLALDAKVRTVRAEGQGREFPINEGFFTGVKRTSLDPGELVREVFVPALGANEGAAYHKYAIRKAMDLAIIGVAAWVKMDGQRVADCRIAVGGAAPTPFRAKEAEKAIIGEEWSEDLLEKVAKVAAGECNAISDVRASAEYRVDMVRVFTKRSLRKSLDRVRP